MPFHSLSRAASRRARPRAALLLLGFLCACSDDARVVDPNARAALERLVPRIAEAPGPGAPAAEDARFVARIGVADARERWRFEGAAHVKLVKDRERPDDPRTLFLEGEEPVHVYVPLPPGGRDFNRVDVELRIERFTTLHVELDRQPSSLVSVPLMGETRPQVVTVRLPYRTTEAEAPDALHLIVGGRGTVRIGGLALYAEPWERRLPDPRAGPEHVRIGGRSRLAYGLSSRAALEFELGTVTARELAFDFAAPGMLRLPSQQPVLELTLLDGAQEVLRRRFPLPTDRESEPPWRTAAVDLAELAGRALTARFSVANAGGREAFCALGEPVLAVRGARAPTAVLITSDTHRADHVDAAGLGVDVRTPALDALAARGVYFENCFTSTNVTNPSHVALMTATHPRDTRIVDNQTSLAEEASTLAESFRANGYLTFACVSASHLEHRLSGLGQGFDRVTAPTDPSRDGRETIDELFEWLAEAEGLPTFVWLHLFDAHTPYLVPAELERAYYPAERDPTGADAAEPLIEGTRPTWLPDVRDAEYVRALYRSEVSYLDGLLAEVFAHERLRDANVVFTADHGESLGGHQVYWDHAGLYPDSVHVPLIVAGPKVPSGVRVKAPVEQLDAGRTLLDLAGLARVEFPGDNLLLAIDAPADDTETRYALAAYGNEASLNRGPWLLVLHLRPHSYGQHALRIDHPLHKTELYRLDRDPACRDDLVDEERETARALRAELVAWLRAARDLGWSRRAAGDADTRAKLAALGYTDEAPAVAGDHPWIEPGCGCEACASFE